MEKFRLNGTTVEIIRFAVKYKEEDIAHKIYISTEDELSLVTARLDSENITYEVEDVDISDCWFLDGKTYTGYDEVFAAIEAGESVFMKKIRREKMTELNEACKSAIHKGIEIEIGGTIKYFSLTEEDQTNIQGLYNDLLLVEQGQPSMLGIIIQDDIPYVPYHANSDFCEYYSAQEWTEIVLKVSTHKLYHTTYINMLHRYMDEITEYDKLLEIQYGITLPQKYNDHLLFITTGGKEGKLIE